MNKYQILFSSTILVLFIAAFLDEKDKVNHIKLSNRELKDTTIIGKAVGIIDGDTFKLLTKDSTLLKVRLANIDCPERKQPFSIKAKQFVSDGIFNKRIAIKVLKKDRYGRYICNVIYEGYLNLSYELVKEGLAWHYIKYSKDTILQSLEDEAKLNRIGLWKDSNPIAPWDWRSRKKKK